MNKTDKETVRKRPLVNRIIDGIIYLAIILILVFWQLLSNAFPDLRIEYILISILILFGASWLHTIQSIEEVKKQFNKIDTTDVMKYGFLQHLFDYVKQEAHGITQLRIFDITANEFLYLFKTDEINVKECFLLLKDYVPNDPNINYNTIKDVQDSIKKWSELKEQGRIKNLVIERYFTEPTDFFCIIDNKMIISGFQDGASINNNPNTLLVDITSRKGYNLIQQYLKKYEYLMQINSLAKNKQFSDGNIFAFSNRANPQQQALLQRELSETKSVISIGVACTELTTLSYDMIKAFFERNGEMQLMFSNPDGEQIKNIEIATRGSVTEYQYPSIVRYNLRMLLSNIKKIKKISENPMKGKIRFYDFYPSINCIITENYVFVHSYDVNKRGIDTPSYVIKKEGNEDIYNYYKEQMDGYWEESKEYEVE